MNNYNNTSDKKNEDIMENNSWNKSQRYKNNKNKDGNILLGIIGGFVASIIAALLWGGLASIIRTEIGYMALGVGFLVGLGVKVLGRSSNLIFALIGALFSIIGCILGSILGILFLVSIESEMEIFEILKVLGISAIIDSYKESFSFMDIIFIILALLIGASTSLKGEPKD